MDIRIATLSELPEGRGTAVNAGEHRLVIFRIGAHAYALDNSCPHAGAPLHLGRVREREITCARHGWVFDIVTGESIPHNPAFNASSYPVKIVNGEVFVELPP